MSAPSDLTAMLEGRGYVVLYRRQHDNACPACGGSNWIIGRTTAECGFCETALPLAEPAGSDFAIRELPAPSTNEGTP